MAEDEAGDETGYEIEIIEDPPFMKARRLANLVKRGARKGGNCRDAVVKYMEKEIETLTEAEELEEE